MYIQLEQVKDHLRLEKDWVEEDEYILSLIDVAESAVMVHANESFESIAERNGGCLPPPLFQAALLMIGNLYQNREIVGAKTQALPNNYQYLIDLFRNYN